MHPVSQSNREYYPVLDVLRGIAILLVFFSHTLNYLHPFEFGWVGVDLFFVLSGFLITEILITSKSSTKHFFRNFFARRALRIFPLYYATLLIFFFVTPDVFSGYDPNSYQYYSQNQAWFWTQAQNWLFVKKGMASAPFLSHFWSLAIEEQFYIVWPLIIYFVSDLKKIKYLIVVLIVSALFLRIYISSNNPDAIEYYYCNTLTRMDSILMGCLVAVLRITGVRIKTKMIYTMLAICGTYLIFSVFLGRNLYLSNPYFSTLGYTVISAFFSLVLYFALHLNVKPELLPKASALSYLGRISYGMYVFHIPIHLFLSSITTNYLTHELQFSIIQAMLVATLLSFIVTIITSSISFFLVEKPILYLKRYFI